MSGVEASTIRRLSVPEGVSHALRVVKSEKELKAAPASISCSYKFAASTKELEYIARRVIHDNMRALELQAPPGVGKSTRFPIALSELTKDRIFVLQPSENLARAQVATLKAAGKLVYFLGEKDVATFRLSKTAGVIYTTPGVFLIFAQLCFAVSQRYVGEPSRYVLIHDECHENDGATYTLRTLWPTMSQITRYIKMSATTGGDRAEARQRHNDAHKLVVRKYPPREEYDVSPADSYANGVPCPWSVTALSGKRTLMFVEDDITAQDLGRRYGKSIPVIVLRRNDPYQRYVEAQTALLANSTMLVIVDSGYQTGYTFNVDVVVDFGIRRQTIDDGSGVLGNKYRVVTSAERRQRVERAARFKPGVAYIPDEAAIESDSVLAPGELGHAAAWFLIMGYQVPAALRVPAIEKFFEADLARFFAAGMPWSYWQRREWVPRAAIEAARAQELAAPPAYPRRAVKIAESAASVSNAAVPVGKAEPRPILKVAPEHSSSQATAIGLEPRPAVVQPAVDVYEWAKRTAEDPRVNLLSRGNFIRFRGDSVIVDPTSFSETLATEGDAALRWLEKEVLAKSPAQLRLTTAVDGVLQWSVWLAAWNYNEAANIAATWYDIRGLPVKYSPPWPPGLRIHDTRINDVYSAVRWMLGSVHATIDSVFPRKLGSADGREYICRALRIAHHNAAFWQRVYLGELRQVDAMYHKMASIAAQKRNKRRTVDSSTDNSERRLEDSNDSSGRFSEVFE